MGAGVGETMHTTLQAVQSISSFFKRDIFKTENVEKYESSILGLFRRL